LFASLQNIVILSIIVKVNVSVESTNVACPHNGTYKLCTFVIFSKTGFVDIAPLRCKPSLFLFINKQINIHIYRQTNRQTDQKTNSTNKQVFTILC